MMLWYVAKSSRLSVRRDADECGEEIAIVVAG
jgi:hypothetical protein